MILAASLLAFVGIVSARTVPSELCERLEDHGDLIVLPGKVDALQLIFRLESPASGGSGRLVPNPGGLPRGPATLPTEASSKPGYYIGVTQATDDPRYVFLVRLADPSYMIGEAPDPKGEIEGDVIRKAGGVLSTRVPFIPGGRLIICEVLPGGRTVLVDEDLGPGPFPVNGMDFKAKRR